MLLRSPLCSQPGHLTSAETHRRSQSSFLLDKVGHTTERLGSEFPSTGIHSTPTPQTGPRNLPAPFVPIVALEKGIIPLPTGPSWAPAAVFFVNL